MDYLKRNIISNIEWLISGLFLIFIPFVYKTDQADPVLYSRYMFLSLWLLCITIIILIKTSKNNFTFLLSRTDKIFFGIAGMFILTNLISSITGVHLFSDALFKSFKEFSFLLMLFYFHQMLRNNPSGLNIIIKSVVLMTAIFLGIGLYQLSQADFTEYLNATEYYSYYIRLAIWGVKSTMANWNPFAYFLFLSLSFSIYASIFLKNIWRIFSIITTIFSITFIALLASKGGWIAALLFILINFTIIYFYLFFRYSKETNKKLASWLKLSLIILPILLIGLGSITLQKTDSRITQLLKNKIEQLSNKEVIVEGSKKQTTVQKRLFLWENTIKIIKDNPILGIGPGQWRIEYAKYGVDNFGEEVRSGAKHYQRPHNDFLWIAAETGIIGLSFFILMYLIVLLVAAKNMFDKTNKTNIRVLNLLAFSSLLVFIMVLSISFTRERITHNLIYLILMAIVLFYKNKPNSKRTIPTINKKWVIAILSIFFILASFNLILAKDMYNGEKVSQSIRVARKQNNYFEVEKAIKSIDGSFYIMDDFSAPLSHYKAMILFRKKDIEGAKKELLLAYKIHPYHLLVLTDLGTIYNRVGKQDSAFYFYNKVLEISPRNKKVLVSTAVMYYKINKYEKAMELLKKVPLKGIYPEKTKSVILAVSYKIAQSYSELLDPIKYKRWLKNKKSPIVTFYAYQETDKEFSTVLINKLGK